MAALGPFEPQPRLGLAVSGGGDSLALLLLADRWAAAEGARLVVLTVDHRLRPAAAGEAADVAALATRLGHQAAILTWDGTKPAHGLAAAARTARYRLLTDWCRQAGILHLLIAHTAEDQAETLMMRLERGSGGSGLAAMTPVSRRAGLRLLRPLLGERRDDLAQLVRLAGLQAVDDPSNHDLRRRRPRWRHLIRDLGLEVPRLAATAGALGREAALIERLVSEQAVRAVTISPFGDGVINRAALAGADPLVVEKLVAQVLAVVGGDDYPPRHDRLARLTARLTGESGPLAAVTLGGCRLWSRPKAPGAILVVREAAAIAAPLILGPGDCGLWDGRYVIRAKQPLTVDALGLKPLNDHDTADPTLDDPVCLHDWPAARRAVLPAAFVDGRRLGPLLPGHGRLAWVEFRPRRPLCPGRFSV